MLETFLQRVDSSLYPLSGKVFYSGRASFAQPSDLYLLGLNPGGVPEKHPGETIERSVRDAPGRPDDWSAYLDESWHGYDRGEAPFQRRLRHVMSALGKDIRHVPASNVVFVRTARERDLTADKADYLARCWNVHEAVIDALKVKAILCFGGTAGAWVREKLGANRAGPTFTEDNARKWKSVTHFDDQGRAVITLTHPSIADWTKPSCDPSPLIEAVLGAR